MTQMHDVCLADERALAYYSPETAQQYREMDEAMRDTPIVQRMCILLSTLSTGYGRPIDVLDLACDSGRYFYCLQNVRRLVGVDLSPSMVAQAHHPITADEISAETIGVRPKRVEPNLREGARPFRFTGDSGAPLPEVHSGPNSFRTHPND